LRIYWEALKSDLAKLLGVSGVTSGLWVAGFLPIAGAQKALYTPLPLLHGLAGELKELRRAIALEVWGNRYAVEVLEEISRAYREMLVELIDYAVRYRASLKNLCTRAIPRARVPLTGLSSPIPPQ